MYKENCCNLNIDDMKGSFFCKAEKQNKCVGFQDDNGTCKYNMMFSCNNIELKLKTLDELIEKLGILKGQLVIEFGKKMYEQVNGNS
jgi:hypothetical protein